MKETTASSKSRHSDLIAFREEAGVIWNSKGRDGGYMLWAAASVGPLLGVAVGRRPTRYRLATISIPTGELTSATVRLRLLCDVSHYRARSRCFLRVYRPRPLSRAVSQNVFPKFCVSLFYSLTLTLSADPFARTPEISGAPSGYRGNAGVYSYLVLSYNAPFALLGF